MSQIEMVSVQYDNFDIGLEYQRLSEGTQAGAVVTLSVK